MFGADESASRRLHRDGEKNCSWRVIYHIGSEAVVVLDYFKKKSNRTPQRVIDRCRERLKRYEDTVAND